jgi:hypothetical protein
VARHAVAHHPVLIRFGALSDSPPAIFDYTSKYYYYYAVHQKLLLLTTGT